MIKMYANRTFEITPDYNPNKPIKNTKIQVMDVNNIKVAQIIDVPMFSKTHLSKNELKQIIKIIEFLENENKQLNR